MPLDIFHKSSSSNSAGQVTARLLLSFLAISSPGAAIGGPSHAGSLPQLPILSPKAFPLDDADRFARSEHNFTLRHIFHHGTYSHPNLHKRFDVSTDARVSFEDEGTPIELASPLHARSAPLMIQRLSDRRPSMIEPLLAAARLSGVATTISPSAWTIDELSGPNVTDKETVLNFAKMSSNAYIMEPGTGDWYDADGGYNYTDSFGWEDDGLRGHIFADETNSTIVMALKGTSPAVFDGAETTTNDKVNDNLFFSCCCAQGGNYAWRQVCDCKTGTYKCNQTCLVAALMDENRYYRASLNLYANLTALYPNSNIWLAGHSLGGSVSAMLGLTYGLPVITYEAPPEALAVARLGLPAPPESHSSAPQTRKYTGAYHIGHTADPIYMGVCNGATSGCSIAGFAMETVCHTGQTCQYKTVEDKGWRRGVLLHRIKSVIDEVIMAYDTVPECKPDIGCVDCFNWKYFESNGSDTTTSKTSTATSASRTRTSTCRTPGWFGCLDETTTTTTTSISSTSTFTVTTTTCKTPGWFGCLDPTTTTKVSATPAPITTTASVPEATASRGHSVTSSPSIPSSGSISSSSSTYGCTSREWFGLICVDPSPTLTSTATPISTGKGSGMKNGRCIQRGWFGQCKGR